MKTYFIQAGTDGPVKIGRTGRGTAERLASLKGASPLPLSLLREIDGDVEADAHAYFASARLHGEWFKPVPELMAFIAKPFPLPPVSASEPDHPAIVRRIDLRAILVAAMDRQGVSAFELSRRAGVHKETVRRYVRGERDIGGERYFKLATAIGITFG